MSQPSKPKPPGREKKAKSRKGQKYEKPVSLFGLTMDEVIGKLATKPPKKAKR